MGDPTRAEVRNPTVGGETSQETADRMAGAGNPPHPSSPSQSVAPTKPVGPNVHPTAKGAYGAPLGGVILGPRNGT
jgi:hypothetical protein